MTSKPNFKADENLDENLRVGLLGAGHLGAIHARLIAEIDGLDLVGIYDPDQEKAKKVAEACGTQAFGSEDALIEAAEALDIVTSTSAHLDCARLALAAGRHIFVEKPIAHSVAAGQEIVKLGQEAGVIVQVGHVERFNPAYLALADRAAGPVFIEGHRLAVFNPRGTDVSVIFDLMIHDLDIVLKLVQSPLSHVSASGVAVISDSPDIANVRLEFENGCVANLTASRISMKSMRRMRLFRPDAYLTMDFGEKQAQIFTLSDDDTGNLPYVEVNTGDTTTRRFIQVESPDLPEVNAIKMELECFRDSIRSNKPVVVSAEEGQAALELAHHVLNKINERLKKGEADG